MKMHPSMLSVDGIERCERFIYDKLASGAKSAGELGVLYVSEVMTGDYSEQQVANESVSFGLAIGTLLKSRRICDIGGVYCLTN